MKTSITKRYSFCSAHWLPHVPEEHKCHRIHGHNYEVEITIQAFGGFENGFVVDFWDLDAVVQPIIELVDHRTLNDVVGLTNPTAEVIAHWFIDRVDDELAGSQIICTKIVVHETNDSFATVQKGSM